MISDQSDLAIMAALASNASKPKGGNGAKKLVIKPLKREGAEGTRPAPALTAPRALAAKAPPPAPQWHAQWDALPHTRRAAQAAGQL